jgi:ORF6N domain
MLDADAAALYRVPTFRLSEAVKRNRDRFPGDFMFQLTAEEAAALTADFAMSNVGRGGRYTLPLAFTEMGVAMLSSVLKSERAVQMNLASVRALLYSNFRVSFHRESDF